MPKCRKRPEVITGGYDEGFNGRGNLEFGLVRDGAADYTAGRPRHRASVDTAGIPTDATGGIGSSITGRPAPGVVPPVPGSLGLPTGAPPPVLMTPEQLRPDYLGPLVIVPELFPLDIYTDLPPTPVVGQGRPGGLGVTITGGNTNPPPIIATATNATSVVTNPRRQM